MRVVLSLALLALEALRANAAVSIYTQVPLGTGTATAPQTATSGGAANDPTNLNPPPVPSPPIATNFVVQLYTGGMTNLSLPQSGAFVGFSIELSVSDQIFGKNGSHINPQFLNLLANIKARAGRVRVRLGGNSQEKAVFFPQGLPGGATIVKDKSDVHGTTDTPAIDVGMDLLYAMSNITSLVNTEWVVGLGFNDSANLRLGIVEASQQILGPNLLGIQVGNEPDLYPNRLRGPTYGPADYVGDFGLAVQAIQNDGNIPNKTMLGGPSTCCNWLTQQVFDAGFLQNFTNSLSFISVEQYIGGVKAPQDVFPDYLNHTSAVALVLPYFSTSQVAIAAQKPLYMLETNTASCGGFPGISDSFGAALWGLDASLQMAFANFSGLMMHVGGQNAYYNAFTPPPGSQKLQKQWTVGPMYYVALIMAEVFGSSNTSQVVDLFMNGNNIYTPGYAIYEGGSPVKVALFNFITDPSGASNYTAQIAIGGSGAQQPNASPSQVFVRYFTSPSVSTKYNFQYAGQTFGPVLSSDGSLQGSPQTVTIDCDASNNLCSVPVPAPGFAVVFLTPEALQQSTPGSNEQVTFATTAATLTFKNTATIDPSVLATSNGRGGANQQIGSTSFGSSGALGMMQALPGAVALACMAAGAALVGKGLVR